MAVASRQIQVFKRQVHSDRETWLFKEKKITSFKETIELTLLCYAENLLSDDEFLASWENHQSSNPDFP